MADKCPHCGVKVGPLATKCYKCGGLIEEGQQITQGRSPPVLSVQSNKYFLTSIFFGALGIMLSPVIWKYVFNLTTSAICSMYTFSAIFGLGALLMGAIMVFKNKDNRGLIGLIMGIIAGILALYPIVFVMVTPF